MGLSEGLDECFEKYFQKHFITRRTILDNFDSEGFGSYDEYNKFIHDKVMQKRGKIENSREFKKIQVGFCKLDCMLNVEYPKDFTVDYDWVERYHGRRSDN